MPKTKRSHHRSGERRAEDGDELSNHSVVSDESDQVVEQKKRHRKKSSKKGKKHRSKRKHSPSDSDSDSSDSSDSSSDSSSEEEVVKRKKQKKHKKNKRRRHDATDERKVDRIETEVEILHEPSKVHYISSDEERHHSKSLKRVDERKRPIDVRPNERPFDYKSKWDSPNDDFERKRKRESPGDRRVEDRFRGEPRGPNDIRPNSFRDRNEKIEKPERIDVVERGHRMDRGRQVTPVQRQERDRFDRRQPEPDFRRDRREDGNQSEWRPRDRPHDRFRHSKDDREPNRDRRFRGDEGRFGRPEMERKRSVSPRGHQSRGRFDERRERDDRRDRVDPPRFNFNDNRRDIKAEGMRGDRFSHDRRPEIKREFNDREVDRSRNDRPRDRSEHEKPRGDTRERRSSPRRTPDRAERPRSPNRSNPFRRNKNPEDHSDFRHDGERPDRNDRSDRNERSEREDDRRPKNGSAPRRKFNNKGSDNENYEWGKPSKTEKDDAIEEPADKEKPNFGLSGKLTEDANKVNGVVIKYAEPPEARRPKRRWRLYPFKNDQSLNTIYIHRQSCFLIGRDKKICEIAVDHPSCSKQHAALQYRLVNYEREDGTVGRRVRPYIIDLESANGTFVNNNKIESRKYFELFEKDIIKFGFSSREYVLLHEDSNVDEDEPIYDEEEDHIKTEK